MARGDGCAQRTDALRTTKSPKSSCSDVSRFIFLGGLTGKIIVDTYGGWSAHSRGAFRTIRLARRYTLNFMTCKAKLKLK